MNLTTPLGSMDGLEFITLQLKHDIEENQNSNKMICIMEGKDQRPQFHLEEQICRIFSEFITRFAKLEELVVVGSRFLSGFQQGLEFLRRPPINKTSELVENIIKANETKRVQSYVQAGCINTHDIVQNMSKLHACQCGLQDSLSQAKCVLDELNGIIEDATNAMQTANDDSSCFRNKELVNELDQEANSVNNMEAFSYNHKVTNYAAMMGVIYCMLKQDYMMQEKIVSSLNLKSSSEELESYCTMWSLRPYINDDIVHRAWKLIS